MRKKMLLTSALAAVIALSAHPAAFAQYSDSPQGNGGQQGWRGHGRMDPATELARMTERLGLTSDQQTQIRAILADRRQKMQALFQNDSLSREDRRSQMMSLRQESNAKIEKLLTDQQKQKFEAMQQRHGRHGWRGGEGDGQGGSGPQ